MEGLGLKGSRQGDRLFDMEREHEVFDIAGKPDFMIRHSASENGKLKNDLLHTAILLLAALVWGMALPFQRISTGYVGGWTFLAVRSWLSVLVMLPVVLWQSKKPPESKPTIHSATILRFR